MVLFNMAILVLVTINLKRKHTSSDMRIRKIARITFSLSLLVGSVWAFGALLAFVDSLVLQYIFAVLVSLQGFLIFVSNILTAPTFYKAVQSSLSITGSIRRNSSLRSMTTDGAGRENWGPASISRRATQTSIVLAGLLHRLSLKGTEEVQPEPSRPQTTSDSVQFHERNIFALSTMSSSFIVPRNSPEQEASSVLDDIQTKRQATINRVEVIGAEESVYQVHGVV